MGIVYTNLTLANPVERDLEPIEVQALADTGAVHLCIPEHVAVQLKLRELETREVVIADGSIKVCPYVGPILVRFHNRTCFTGALVLGKTVLLGAIPMEDMDLIVHPAQLKVVPNPESPNIPTSIAM